MTKVTWHQKMPSISFLRKCSRFVWYVLSYVTCHIEPKSSLMKKNGPSYKSVQEFYFNDNKSNKSWVMNKWLKLVCLLRYAFTVVGTRTFWCRTCIVPSSQDILHRIQFIWPCVFANLTFNSTVPKIPDYRDCKCYSSCLPYWNVNRMKCKLYFSNQWRLKLITRNVSMVYFWVNGGH